MPFATTWMDLETVILSEVSHRRRNIVWHSLYVESKKNDANELMYKIERDSDLENELMVAMVGGHRKG